MPNLQQQNEDSRLTLSEGSSITPVAVTPSRIHLDFLDGLRALAALMVIIDHAYCILWWDKQGYIPQGRIFILGNVQLAGHFAVSVFIVLSGYCLMLPVVRGNGELKGGARGFYWKRARRILPPYYFALALSLLLIATLLGQPTQSHWDPCIPVTFRGLLAHVFLVHNLLPDTTLQINNALWSVAVEWQIYFLFPLLIVLWKRVGGGSATLIVLLCAYGVYLVIRHTSINGLQAPYTGLFALGALGAAVSFHPAEHYQTARRRLPYGMLCLLLIGFVTALCHFLTWPQALRHLAILDLLVGIATMLILIEAARSHSSVARSILSWKPLVFIGSYSYSIYLIHVPIQQLFWQYGLRPFHLASILTFCLLVLLGTPFILGVAYLFFLFCERPFMNTKRKP